MFEEIIKLILSALGIIVPLALMILGFGAFINMAVAFWKEDLDAPIFTTTVEFHTPEKIDINVEHEDAPKDTAENPSEQTSVAKTPDDTTA